MCDSQYQVAEALGGILPLQVRFQLEQTREGLQRQLAATDGQLHVLQARLEDSSAEQQVCCCSAQSSIITVCLSFLSVRTNTNAADTLYQMLLMLQILP